MKTVQKLEIIAGVATFLAAILSFIYIGIPDVKVLEELGYSSSDSFRRYFLFLLLPALFTVVGAYIHAMKQSIVGFVMLFVCGGLITFLHAIGFLVGTGFGGYLLIGVSPGIFAALTIFFAICLTIVRRNSPSRLA